MSVRLLLAAVITVGSIMLISGRYQPNTPVPPSVPPNPPAVVPPSASASDAGVAGPTGWDRTGDHTSEYPNGYASSHARECVGDGGIAGNPTNWPPFCRCVIATIMRHVPYRQQAANEANDKHVYGNINYGEWDVGNHCAPQTIEVVPPPSNVRQQATVTQPN